MEEEEEEEEKEGEGEKKKKKLLRVELGRNRSSFAFEVRSQCPRGYHTPPIPKSLREEVGHSFQGEKSVKLSHNDVVKVAKDQREAWRWPTKGIGFPSCRRG